jgi:hydroxypyruvate isomerase
MAASGFRALSGYAGAMPKLAANLSMLFVEVEFLSYGGWIGCEYNPLGDTREGLKWAKRYLS